jgi:serine-type D-Ala-D-Ala carboxypeptidase/endopeptidase (penicillin-binding protein 4)
MISRRPPPLLAHAIGLAVLLAGADAVPQTPPPSAPSASPAPPPSGASPASGAPSVASPPIFAALPTPAEGRIPEIEALVRALVANVKDASIGVAVLDVTTGRYLAVHNEHAPLNPASNAKLYTAGAALALLHGDHRYETSLSGTVKGGTAGSVVLRGHGDPSLTTADLWAMVQELRARGVRKIDGDILVDQRFYDEQTTPPAFEQQPDEWAAFRAPVSAIALNENTVTLSVRPSGAEGSAVAWFEPPGFVDVDGTIKTGDEGADNIILALSPSGHRLSAKISGTIASDSKLVRYYRRVEDPTLLAGYAMKALLDKADIKVTGDVKAGHLKGATTIARHESAPLSALLYEVGKHSDNFYAEMIFKSLGGELKQRPGRSADGAQLVTQWAQRIGAADAGLVIRNGSGLFDANRVTTASVVQVLRACYMDSAIGPEYVAQLAVGGVDGTLAKRFREHRQERSIRAKTGTLEDATALSGYVLGSPGKGSLAFSVLVNKAPPSAVRIYIDRFVDKLADRVERADSRTAR